MPWLTAPPRALWNLLLGAFVVRWLGLEKHALSAAEVGLWQAAQAPTWGDTLAATPEEPPVGRLLTRAVIALWGDGEDRLRMPAAVLGVVAVFLAWRLGLALFDPGHAPRRGGFARGQDAGQGRRLALWFTGAVAFAPAFVALSQQALPGTLLLVEALGLVLLYLRWIDRGGWGSLAGLTALGVLAQGTHLGSLAVLLGLLGHAVWARLRPTLPAPAEPRVPLAPVALAIGAALLLGFALAALAPQAQAGAVPAEPPSPLPAWAERLGRAAAGPALAVVDHERAGATVTRIVADEQAVVLGVAVAWLPALLLGGLFLLRLRAGGALLGLLALLALGGGALRAQGPGSDGTVVGLLSLWLWPIALLGAHAVGGWARRVLLALLVLVAATGLLAYHGVDGELVLTESRTLRGESFPAVVSIDAGDPTTFLHRGHPYGSEPWREVRMLIGHYAEAGDLVLLGPGLPTQAWPYYGRGRRGAPLDALALGVRLGDPRALASDDAARLRARRRVFVIASEGPEAATAYATVFKACGAAWASEGAHGLDAVPPIEFRRAGGLRVSFVERR